MGGKAQGTKAAGNIMKRGSSWYVRLRVEGRDVWRGAGKSKENAQIMLAKLREDADRGIVGRPKRSTKTLEAFAPVFLAWAKLHKRSWKRDELSLGHLVKRLGAYKLADLDNAKVEAYQRARAADRAVVANGKARHKAERKVSAATVNREVACLRKLLRHAVEVKELSESPLGPVTMLPEAEGRVPLLDADDQAKLFAAAEETAPWFVPFLRLALATGARAGELCALKWRNVDFDEGEIPIERSKGGAPRHVPVAHAVLADLRSLRQHPEAPVFTQANGSPLAVWGASTAFKRLARTIGRGEMRLHDLRHVAATRFLGHGGAALPEVASLLGQKTLVMARRYAHATKSRLRSIVEGAEAHAPAGGAKGDA